MKLRDAGFSAVSGPFSNSLSLIASGEESRTKDPRLIVKLINW